MNYPACPCATCSWSANYPNCTCAHFVAYQQSLQISNLAGQVSSTAMLLSQSQAENANLKNRVDVLQRNRKKFMTDARLFCDDRGIMVIAQYYNNGPVDYFYLFEPHQGLGEIITYDMQPKELPLSHDYITIEIKTCTANGPLHFYARKDKLMSADFCYDLFIHYHIIFNPAVKTTVLKKALKSFLIQSTNNTFAPKMLSGWLPSSWKFFSAENCRLEGFFTAAEAPVLNKSFENIEVTKESLDAYFAELRAQFPEPEVRLLIALLPMMGLTSSLLAEYDKAINFATALIPVDGVSTEVITSWLQIYNRTITEIVDGSLVLNKLKKAFASRCDDVVLVDLMDYPGQSAYDKKKKAANASFIINRVASGLPISRVSTNIVTVLLSSSFVDGDCLQMPITITFNATVHRQFLNTKSIETVFTGLVRSIETHETEVRELLQTHYNEDPRVDCLQTALSVAEYFFEKISFNLLKELEIPEDFDPSNWFVEEGESGHAVLETFRKCIRQMSAGFTACAVNDAKEFNEKFVYFDSDFLYFSCEFLKRKFREVSQTQLLQRALLLLKDRNKLFPGSGGSNYRKKVLASERHSFYTIRRSFFTQPGEADILALMKEVPHYVH